MAGAGPKSQRRGAAFARQTVSRSRVTGARGAVAGARRASVEAAVEMLERGGNAVDAAVAGAFVRRTATATSPSTRRDLVDALMSARTRALAAWLLAWSGCTVAPDSRRWVGR